MTDNRPTFRTRNTSLPVDIDRAAVELARRAGHGNVSRLLQDLVSERAIKEIGPDWREAVSGEEAA